MYEYFIGKITSVTPHYVVLEIGGIGYQIYVANPFRYQVDLQIEQKLYIYQNVKENEITLYGFFDLSEKQIFLKLLSVSGIGPKSALAILATQDLSGLVGAIDNNDEAYLTKFPSIGKKTAKQIILDLKGKMDDIQTPTPMFDQIGLELEFNTEQQYLKESLEALLALGYTKNEVKRISKKLEKFDASSTDEYLRYGLKLLMNK